MRTNVLKIAAVATLLHFAASVYVQGYGVSAAVARRREHREVLHVSERISHATFNVLLWPSKFVEWHVHRLSNSVVFFGLSSVVWGAAAAVCWAVLSRSRHQRSISERIER
jgi:hypothetical protein